MSSLLSIPVCVCVCGCAFLLPGGWAEKDGNGNGNGNGVIRDRGGASVCLAGCLLCGFFFNQPILATA